MISKEEILRLHHLSISRYGGADGIRDEGLLESAIARPYPAAPVCRIAVRKGIV